MPQDTSEQAYVRPPRSWSFYFVLFFAVAPEWSIVPISWSFVLFHLLYRQAFPQSILYRGLFVVALCESLFSVYCTVRTVQVSAPAPNSPNDVSVAKDALRRAMKAGMSASTDGDTSTSMVGVDRPASPEEEIIQLEHDDPRAIDFRNCVRTWFGKVPWSHIHTKEVEAWLHWCMFSTSLPPDGEMSSVKRTLLSDAVKSLEMRAGKALAIGSNPVVKPLLPTLDPVNVCARPLLLYLVVKGASLCFRKWCTRQFGLRYRRFGELEYLIRIPEGYNRSTGPDPVIFIHGLGFGIIQYYPVLAHFCQELPHVPLLIPLQPQLSQDIFHPRYLKPMGRVEKADLLGRVLHELGWVGAGEKESKGVTVLSHSNGSYSHAWLIKTHPEFVSRSCFVDPVTFCLWEGDFCYNFLYSSCTDGFQLLIRYFVGTELGVANLLQRHFDWLSNALWLEEIPNSRDARRNLYVLGGKDPIVNTSRVHQRLQSHGVTDGLWIDPNGHHGQALLTNGRARERVLEWLKDNPTSKVV